MSEPENPPPAVRRAIFLFDGQNIFKSLREVYDFKRWRTDPKKLARLVAGRIKSDVKEVRFYTGYPRWDKHRDVRAFWERKLGEYREDGIITEFRQLQYRGADDTRGREKGIDVLVALDALQAVIDGGVDDVVIFSQDNDLSEVPGRAFKFLDREAERTGVRRDVRFHSAYPYDPAQEARAHAWVEGDGERPRANFFGIRDYRWVALTRADFDGCVDDREVALEAQKVDLPAELERLERKHRKRVNPDYDVAAGGGYVEGRVAAVIRLPNRGVIVFETRADLLAVKVGEACLGDFDRTVGKLTHARIESRNGDVQLGVIQVTD